MEKRNTYTKSAGFVPGLSKVLLPGDLLDDRYELLELLGDGGMGRVYKARHLILDTIVAIKILHYRGVNDVVSKDRFLSEVRVLKKLNHDRILKVLDAGASLEGYYYLVTEYLEGETLKSWIARHEERDESYLKQAVDYILDICDGIMSAHENGVIHRDLKPSNIFLSRDGFGDVYPKILDFGLAAERSGRDQLNETIGTEGYMSPEQKAGIETDLRTDVYALGAMLYEALTGSLPEKDKSNRTFSRSDKSAHAITPPSRLNPHVPRKLDRACLIALERDAGDRYQTILSFFEALSSVWPIRKTVQNKRSSKKKQIIFGIAAVALLLCSVGLAWQMGVNYGSRLKKPSNALSIAAVSPLPSHRETVDVESTSPHLQEEKPQATEPMPKQPALKAPSPPPVEKQTAPVAKPASPDAPFKRISALQREQASSLIDEGYKELRGMRLDKAEELFSNALKILPAEPRALFGLGKVMFEQERYGLAAIRMEAALRLRNNAEWRLNLGAAFFELGREDFAVREWKRVIADFPQDESARKKAQAYLQKIGENVEP